MTTLPYELTYELQAAIRAAQNQAREHAHGQFSPGHLLWGILTEDAGLHPFLERLGKDVFKLRAWADFRITHYPKSPKIPDNPPADDKAQLTMKEADKIRSRKMEPYVSPIHVLEAICTPEIAFTAEQLKRFPISPGEFSGQMEQESAVADAFPSSNGSGTAATAARKSGGKALDKYCEDLTGRARQGKIDPVIGRDKELKQLVEILGKRLSPNVLIIGEPGVGKTAVVGGLALSILDGKIPSNLKDAAIFELDVNGRLVAGAYKGEVEERLKDVLRGVKDYNGKAILFIDEIHALLDEQGSVGTGAVNLLKPELARGELTVIGATTQVEYRKFIESDEAFRRRFTVLKIEEPEVPKAIKMMDGLAPRFESHHELEFDKTATAETVRLAKRYMADKNLPVSALELIDLTMSAVRVMNDTSAQELTLLEEEWKAIETEESPEVQAIRKADFEEDVRNRLSHILVSRLNDWVETNPSSTWPEKFAQLRTWSAEPQKTVRIDDIIAMVAYRTGIPMGKIQSKEQERLMKMEEHFRKRVLGQDHALVTVGEALRRARAGLKEPNKPAAVFFFLGPTGTGKTELAKTIAELLFNDENALIRFDMSEFKEQHSVALMYGSPPGYVGYKEGGLLVNKIRQQPYSVVLFDEIEKAHQSIYDIFLQILDEGQVHDKLDKKGDFTNAIVIFTSNIGSEWITKEFTEGRIPTDDQLKELIQSSGKFRPEMLGRTMDIIPFSPITEEIAPKILDIHLGSFKKLLRQQNIELALSEEARMELVRSGFSPFYGARPLKETIRRRLGNSISNKIIGGEITPGSKVELGWNDKENDFDWQITKG
ncbi:MAG: ATP-dependent Clp protease ATP-binding subunit [Lewinellaceae bacterium]|nr:ATP-dependent Clp protease ATP-binding subunit [Saprospiraceae bacterium]MCB9339194.1 ATP-dependent Clp protease ATP-binding subunit [Lewinellaceae bacterium]